MQFEPGIPALYLHERPSQGDSVSLPEEEERHARALRLREGDGVILLDGRGGRTRAVVERLDRRGLLLRAGATLLEGAEGRPYIALGVGILSDRSRFEWIVEKGVELGAREIIPLVTERSEGRFQAERANRIAVAALKQSQRAYLPDIPSPLPFAAMLDRTIDRSIGRQAGFDLALVCHESAPAADTLAAALLDARTALPETVSAESRIALFIGPEGGFSPAEIEQARAASARIVSLGEARLRAETAALVALALTASLAGPRP